MLSFLLPVWHGYIVRNPEGTVIDAFRDPDQFALSMMAVLQDGDATSVDTVEVRAWSRNGALRKLQALSEAAPDR